MAPHKRLPQHARECKDLEQRRRNLCVRRASGHQRLQQSFWEVLHAAQRLRIQQLRSADQQCVCLAHTADILMLAMPPTASGALLA